MNSLWDIRIFLGLVPKESLCTMTGCFGRIAAIWRRWRQLYDLPVCVTNQAQVEKFTIGHSVIVTITADGVRAPEHHGAILRGVSRRCSGGGGLCSTISTTTAVEEQQAPREGPARGRAPTRAPPRGFYRSVISTMLHVVVMPPRTGCFTTLGHNCRRWFPRSLWWKKFT